MSKSESILDCGALRMSLCIEIEQQYLHGMLKRLRSRKLRRCMIELKFLKIPYECTLLDIVIDNQTIRRVQEKESSQNPKP